MRQKGMEQKPDDGIVWEDPPEPNRSGGGRPNPWPDRLRPLMKHLGKWAKLGAWPSTIRAANTAESMRRSPERYLPSDASEWEITSCRNGDGSYLYARYTGEKQQ